MRAIVMNFGPAGEGTDIMVKLVGWCDGISNKVRLAIANKKIHPPFHLARLKY